MSNPDTAIRTAVLDPEDGEAGIVEVHSGRVLARFTSLRKAAAHLRLHRAEYQAKVENQHGQS